MRERLRGGELACIVDLTHPCCTTHTPLLPSVTILRTAKKPRKKPKYCILGFRKRMSHGA